MHQNTFNHQNTINNIAALELILRKCSDTKSADRLKLLTFLAFSTNMAK